MLVGSSRSFLEEARQESGAVESWRRWPAVDQSFSKDKERWRERKRTEIRASRDVGCVVREESGQREEEVSFLAL